MPSLSLADLLTPDSEEQVLAALMAFVSLAGLLSAGLISFCTASRVCKSSEGPIDWGATSSSARCLTCCGDF